MLQRDHEHFAGGQPPHGDSVEEQIHSAFFVDSDARKALAMATIEDVHPVLLARGHIGVGNLEEAEQIIENLESESGSMEDRYEFVFDKARIHALGGNWTSCISICNEAIAYRPAGITYLSFVNLRALAHFESLNFLSCERDLDQIETLVALYPHSVSTLYHSTLRVKLLSFQKQIFQAETLLNRLWKNILQRSIAPTKDEILSLLRAEITIRRCQNRSALDFSCATYFLAQSIGNDLYSSFALLDIYCDLLNADDRKALWGSHLESACSKHNRIQGLFNEITSHEVLSESATAHQLRLAKSRWTSSESNADECARFFLSHIWSDPDIFLLERNVFIQLQEWRVQKVVSPQFSRACSALARGPLSREEFFNQVWAQSFHSHLHDSPINALISRLRKLGIDASSANKLIEVKNLLTIGSL